MARAREIARLGLCLRYVPESQDLAMRALDSFGVYERMLEVARLGLHLRDKPEGSGPVFRVFDLTGGGARTLGVARLGLRRRDPCKILVPGESVVEPVERRARRHQGRARAPPIACPGLHRRYILERPGSAPEVFDPFGGRARVADQAGIVGCGDTAAWRGRDRGDEQANQAYDDPVRRPPRYRFRGHHA